MMPKEVRALTMPLEIRTRLEDEQEKFSVVGLIKYDQESEVLRDVWDDKFIEVLTQGVFDESLKKRNVVALWSHDLAQVLGNTKNGTLRLKSDEVGLHFELDLPDTTCGSDAFKTIQRGDVDGVSFGMLVEDDKWDVVERDGEKIYRRTILKAELFEISPVAFPAYPNNHIDCRSLDEYRKSLKDSQNDLLKRKLALELELL